MSKKDQSGDSIQESKVDPKLQEEINQYKKQYVEQASPFEKAGMFSKFFFSWMGPIFKISSKTPFQQDMYYKLREEDTAQICYKNLV